MTSYVAIECEGKIQVHASGEDLPAPYATLCGLDGDDSRVGQKPAPLMIGARINCPQCRALIMAAKKYRPRDFADIK